MKHWVTADGRRIPVKKLSDKHLSNIIDCLYGAGNATIPNPWQRLSHWQWAKILHAELDRRKRNQTKMKKQHKVISKAQAIKLSATLRSGRYNQTQFTLQTKFGHCCLGVACEIFAPKYKRVAGLLKGTMPSTNEGAPRWLSRLTIDFYRKTGIHLTNLNDGNGEVKRSYTFNEIADLIDIVYVYDRESFNPLTAIELERDIVIA